MPELKHVTKRNITEENNVDDKASVSTAATDIGENSSMSDENVVKKAIVNNQEKAILRYLMPQIKDLNEANPDMPKNPSEWTVDHVASFLSFIGFPEQANIFKEQEIDGLSLLLLKRMDVLCGLSLKLGPALKIYGHVQRLQSTIDQEN